MGPYIRSGTMLLLGLTLILLSSRVAGRWSAGGAVAFAGPAPAAWAPTGPLPGSPDATPVIASTRPTPPPTVHPVVPVPDDGLSALLPRPSRVRPTRGAESLPPRPIPADLSGPAPIRQALYLPRQDTPPGTESTRGIQLVSGGAGNSPPIPPSVVGRAPEPFAPAPAPAPVPAPGPAPTTVPAAGSGSAAPLSRPAAVSLDINGPAQVTPGQPMVCQIVVRNTGAQVLAQVKVELPLPPGVRALLAEPPADNLGETLVWRLGNLEENGERVIKLELQPPGPGDVQLRPLASYALATGLKTSVVRPPFAVTVTAPATAAPNAVVPFQIQVANHQGVPVERVVLRVQLQPGLGHPQGSLIEADVGTLGAGEVRTLHLETSALRSGRWNNEVTAYGDGVPEAHARAAVQVTEPALQLTSESPRQSVLHQVVTFQVAVNNPSRQSADNVRLSQMIPDGLQFIDASSGASYNPATHGLVWPLGNLASGQRQVVNFRARCRLAGDWALPAAVAADGMAEARLTQALHVDAAPTLALEATVLDDPLQVGAETTLEIRTWNQGPAEGTNLRLLVQVPDTLVILRAEGPSNGQVRGQGINFDPLPRLASRADAVYRVRVRGLRPGSGRFRVELTTNSSSTPLSQEITSNVRGVPAASATRGGS